MKAIPIAIAAATLSACAAQPLERFSQDVPPVVLTTVSSAGVRDLRAVYRGAACARLPDAAPACDDVLLRLPGEGPVPEPLPARDLTQRYRVAFVPGLFAECFERFVRPFDDARRGLESEGFAADYIRVSGRGSAAANAKRIAEQIAALPADPRPIILFAYSKGLTDALEFVVQHPGTAKRVAAIVSVAGAVNGTPLAERLESAYRGLAAVFPFPDCAAGNGDEIEDLRRDVRLEWWQRHRQAVTVPVFALVAAPRPDRVSPATRSTHARLSQIDARNDGKLLWQDQIAPGGFLLGFANADHWAIAVPLTEELPALSFAFRDDLPRAALVRAAIEVVAATLDGGAPR